MKIGRRWGKDDERNEHNADALELKNTEEYDAV
jgi:hypothetical protein